MQDLRGGAGDGDLLANNPDFGGSDIIYSYGALPMQPRPGQLPDSFWGIPYYGVDPDFFYPDPNAVFVRNTSFCGYIPPLVPQMENQPFLSLGDKHLTYGELEYYMVREKQADARLSPVGLHRLILDKINAHFGLSMSYMRSFSPPSARCPHCVASTWTCRACLIARRSSTPRCPSAVFELFGLPTWLTWPKYRAHYRHMLNWRSDLADVIAVPSSTRTTGWKPSASRAEWRSWQRRPVVYPPADQRAGRSGFRPADSC